MGSYARTAVVIRPRIEEHQRVIAISDIHGNLPFLQGVLKKINFSPADVLVLVGDLFEKGGESLAVLRYLLELREAHRVYPLCGNCDHIDRVFLEGRPGIDEELWPVFRFWGKRSLILQLGQSWAYIRNARVTCPPCARPFWSAFPGRWTS